MTACNCNEDAHSFHSTKMFAPKRGRQHIHHLMEHFFANQGVGKTSLENALKRLIDVQKQKSIVFIISDFLQLKIFLLTVIIFKL